MAIVVDQILDYSHVDRDKLRARVIILLSLNFSFIENFDWNVMLIAASIIIVIAILILGMSLFSRLIDVLLRIDELTHH